MSLVNQLKAIQDGTLFLEQDDKLYFKLKIHNLFMKFIFFNILVYFIAGEVEKVVEDGVEWTKMPIEFEEVDPAIENL